MGITPTPLRRQSSFTRNWPSRVQAGHVAIFPLEAVNALQNLWISPVAANPQVGRHPHLIFNFTWSGLNKATKCLAPMETMRFGGALQRILRQVLTADPRLGPVYLNKVEMLHAYMRLWVRIGDVPSFAFLIPKKTPSME